MVRLRVWGRHNGFFLCVLFCIFWLRWVFIAARQLSLVGGEQGLLFVVVRGLLIAVASLVAEHGLCVGFSSCSTQAQ